MRHFLPLCFLLLLGADRAYSQVNEDPAGRLHGDSILNTIHNIGELTISETIGGKISGWTTHGGDAFTSLPISILSTDSQ
jgi:hypothetical protein